MNPSGYQDVLNTAVMPTQETEYLDLLTAYRQTEGRDKDLDLARKVVSSFNYFPLICGWPDGPLAEQTFAPYQTKEGSININARAILVGMTSYCSVDSVGLRVTLTDKGSGLSLGGQPQLRDQIFMSRFFREVGLLGLAPGVTVPGITWLLDPVVVTPPGQIQVTITNMSAADTVIAQIALMFAVPANDMTLNTISVSGGLSSRGRSE
jgi:hypothetical protein